MTNFKRTTNFTRMTDSKPIGPSDLGDPKRWLDDGASALLGSLTRAGAEECPSSSAKHRARAAVLLATAGGAASAAATKAAAASTTASAAPATLATSGAGAATSGAAGMVTSGVGVSTAGVSTAGIAGAAGLSAKFGASSVLLGVAAKWTGVSAMVAAVGFGGYQLTSSGGTANRLTEAAPSAAVSAGEGAVETRKFPNIPGAATSEPPGVNEIEGEAPVSPALVSSAGISPIERRSTSRDGSSVGSSRHRAEAEQATSTARAPSAQLPAPEAAAELPTTLTRNRELALVDRAWAALRTGNPSEALRLIDGYPWTASDRQFEAEALLIRLEGLSQSQQHTAARALARRVLENHQRGRLADKARRVLGSSHSNSP